jgi:acyl-CoA synthetase (AMP-forming)/AMP-acid ligase II/thioesterase domain-containing protein/acyl carrier protein
MEGEQLSVKDLIINGLQDPDAPAIESPGCRPLSYRALREQISGVVRSLNAMGLVRNDRIAVVMPQGSCTAVAILAVMAGFTVVPLAVTYKKPEYDGFFSRLGIRAVLVREGDTPAAVAAAQDRKIPVIEARCSPETAGAFALVPEPAIRGGAGPVYAGPQDIAAIKMTTGTTAEPKMVPVSQKRFFTGMRLLNAFSGLNSRDRNLQFSPLDTGFGFETALGGTLLTGGSLVCLGEFIPADFLSILAACRPTYYWCSPAHHEAILEELNKAPGGLPARHTLRFACSGSAAIPAARVRELEDLLGIPVFDVYVMSEAYISLNNPGRPGSVGIPICNLEIWDDLNAVLPAGREGEIVVRGELVFDGYLDAPAENAQAFTDGWFRTGDTGYLDGEGYLYLTGRKKELINKGGRKIAPAEIDAVLRSHPQVRDAMTFRIPDPVLGEDIAVMVVARDTSVSEDGLHRYCLDNLAQFKVPRRIVLVTDIPKNALGKPQRDEGTRLFGTAIGSADSVKGPVQDDTRTADSSIEATLSGLWHKTLESPPRSPDDDFFLCGGNSLTAIELLIRIQREYHVTLPPDTIYRYPTITRQALLIGEMTRKTPAYHPLVVPIRTGGTLPPLFCIHALGGWIDHYTLLAPYIGSNRPVFGIRARGLEPAETSPPTVEETAQDLADAVKSVSAKGPYYILGFSNGGVIAFEIACQLAERGDQVAFLGIIDQSAPASEVWYFRTLAKTLFPGRLLGKIPAFFETRLKANPESRVFYLVSTAIRTAFRPALSRSGTKSLPPSVSDAHFRANFNDGILTPYPEASHTHMKAQLKASHTYLPHTYPGSITLFSTGPDPILFPRDDTRGWAAIVTGKVVVIPVPGNHATLFDEPNLAELGKYCDASLRAADDHANDS